MTEDQRFLAEVREEQGTVFVALDSGEVFELAPGSVPEQLPAVGESISSPLLAEIKSAAERKQIARRLFAMLDKRLQPVFRLHSRLTEQGFSAGSVSAVLDQMAERDFYSDRHYAEAYCRDCLRGKAVGSRYLEKKLREKRVAPDIAAIVPREILDHETEQELALTAARSRWRRERETDRRKAEAKVIRYLVGRGFPVGVASKATRRTWQEMTEESS